MQTRREWLAERGLAIAGARGKFSNAAREALVKAEAEGVKFADAAGGSPTKPTGPRPPARPVDAVMPDPQPQDPRNSSYLLPSDYRYPEAEYVARVAGKPVSMRECCNTCMVSLVNHACQHPTIHDNLPVVIGRR